MTKIQLAFNCMQEAKPGAKWQAHFLRTWASYQQWFLSEGPGARKGYLTSSEALRFHIPELVPIYDHLVNLVGGGDLEARFLSMYCPPAYMTGCSQLAWTKNNETILIRNYDYSYKMFEGLQLFTNWLQPVIGISDCGWGLLDGINGSGLAASLTFGGRKVVGEGFGIPLIIRYVLEVATNTSDALAILKRIPVHMAYNVTLVDKNNSYTTVYLSPDRPPVVLDSPVSANHQTEVEWSDYASLTKTIERQAVLDRIITEAKRFDSVIDQFQLPPLYNTSFHKGFGTLYTIQYDLKKQEVKLMWPYHKSLIQSLDHFTEQRTVVDVYQLQNRLLN